MDTPLGAPTGQPQAPHGLSHTVKFAIVIAIALIAVLLIGGGVVMFLGGKHKGLNLLSGKTISYGPPPKGLLVMTIARETGGIEQLLPAVYDLSTKKLSYPPVDQLAGVAGKSLAIQHSFSDNGDYAAFVGATNPASTGSPLIPTQIYRADLSTAASNADMVVKLQGAQSVTTGSSLVRLSPSISNKNEIVYFAHAAADTGTLTLASADEWEVHLISSAGNDKVVVSGIYPKWVGDDQFIYIKEDGLHLYSTVTKSDKKIWGSKGGSSIGMNLNVSNDYQYVAWIAPKVKGVFLFRVGDWAKGDLTLTSTLHLLATGVGFSPDSRLLIVQSPLSSASGSGIVETFFDLSTMKNAVSPYAIHNVDQKLTFLSDWIL